MTRAELLTIQAALDEIDQLSHGHLIHPQILANLRDEYERKVKRNITMLTELHFKEQQIKSEELKWVQRHLKSIEKKRSYQCFS